MGFILSKFRKEKSTSAVLEGLQVEIQDLEKYAINTQERKRRFVTNFVGITIGAYIVGFALWYFFYFPPTMQKRIMYLVPLLLFPVLIIFLRQVFTWYFQRKLNKNGDKLNELKQKKARILEQVMDKETYKVAVQLLERFGDKQQTRIIARQNQNSSVLNHSATPSLQRTPRPVTTAAAAATQQRALTPYSSVYRSLNNNINTSVMAPQMQMQLQPATPQLRAVQELRRRTPFPVVDESSRSPLDRILDLIVGDSPQNRFAMICKECHKHNGMLPMEEYEYTTFHCAFCEALNPARKERPVAPRLAIDHLPPPSFDSSDDDNETSSEDDKQSVRRALHIDSPRSVTDAEMDEDPAGEADIEPDVETISYATDEPETDDKAAKEGEAMETDAN